MFGNFVRGTLSFVIHRLALLNAVKYVYETADGFVPPLRCNCTIMRESIPLAL
jgi:hypothetical protein